MVGAVLRPSARSDATRGRASVTRLGSLALAASLALGVQTAYGVPTRSAGVVRALWCCSAGCDHARSPAGAARCCGIGGDAVDMLASPHAEPARGWPVVHASIVERDAPSTRLGPTSSSALASQLARARGAPLFLLTRSFRI